MNKANIETIYALSPIQQGMLFHSLYETGVDVYFEQFNWTFHEGLDVAAFERAWQRVVQQHPILRTSFHWEDLNEALQIVHRRVQVPIEHRDWRGLDAAEQETRLDEYLKADRRRGFELAKAPLFRLTLIRMGEDSYHLVWSYHHLLLDGWSIPLVRNDFFTVYEAYRAGKEASLKPRRPYRDYILWLRRQDLASAEAFWRQLLQGFSAPTAIAMEPEPGARVREDYASQQLLLSETTTQALQALARQARVTLNTLVQGAWALLLSRYSGEQDVVYGATVSGRPAELAGSEGMIGVFINTLPMRVRLDSQSALLPWLQQIQRQQAEQRRYESTPLVEIQRWSEIPRGTSLFESIVVFENYPSEFSQGRQHMRIFQRTNYPLTLVVDPTSTLALRLSYECRHFDTAAIERMLGHLRTLLEGMVATPEARLNELPLLSEAELRQLASWNATEVSYPPDLLLHELVAAQAARTPDAVALTFEEQQLTYAALDARANQLAHHLQSLGVGPEVLVAVCLHRSLNLVVALLGILKAGGAYVPLDPSYPQERLAFMMEDAQVHVLLTTKRQIEGERGRRGEGENAQVQDLPLSPSRPLLLSTTVVDLDTDWHHIAQQPTTNLDSGVTPENLAYAIYTSGSTGKPKGALNTHRGIVNRLLWMQERYQLSAGDRVMQKTPFSFDVSVWEFFWPLLVGARLVLARPEGHRDVVYLAELIEQEQITTLHFVPSMLRAFLDGAELGGCTSLKRVICSGEALSLKHQEDFFAGLRAELHNLYGPTEAAVDVSVWACRPEPGARSVPIGHPIANTELHILDRQMRPVPVGVTGELYIGGVQLARGYHNRPDLTAERFVPNPFAEGLGARDQGSGREGSDPDPRLPTPDPRLYRTGDLCRYRSDGAIEYLGRIDHQVKLRGFRIELGEIELRLRQHPQVREAVVMLRADGGDEPRLVAYVVQGSGVGGQGSAEHAPDSPIPDPRSLAPDLRAFLQPHLPEYMIPSAFVTLEALPLSPNGKLDRKALPAVDTARPELAEDFVPASTDIEEQLAEVWQQVLHISQVGVHDNFFSLGGDSIRSLQLIAKAAQLGLRFTPGQLFQHPTIARLAQVVGRNQHSLAQQAPVTGPVPLIPIHHWFFALSLPFPDHWNQALLFELPEPLAPSLLQAALAHLLVHHDALRLRFRREGEGWHALCAPPDPPEQPAPFQVFDLAALPPEEQDAQFTQAASTLQASLDLGNGPLLQVAYFQRGAARAPALLVVVHHLAVDAVSWGILLDDLLTAYAQLQRGVPVVLPPKTTSFQRWAEQLHDFATSDQLQAEAPYWHAAAALPLLALPLDHPEAFEANTEDSTQSLLVSLEAEETQALLEQVPTAYQTQISEVLLTALALSLGASPYNGALLLDLEGHGRVALDGEGDLSRTAGWFTAIYPLRLELPEGDDPGSALKTVKEQVRRVPRQGLGYGVLRELVRDEVLRSQPKAALLFNYLGPLSQLLPSEAPLRLAPESVGASRDPHAQRSHELELRIMIVEGQLRLEWLYSQALHKRATVAELAERTLLALRNLIAHCLRPDAGGYTPSDVAEFEWDQTAIDKISQVIGKKSPVAKTFSD